MTSLQRLTAPTAEVLRVLLASPEPMWGLQVIKSTGRAAGTVYPILERLESAGFVESRWEDDPSRPGPRRRYYELTETGAVEAEEVLARFASRVATGRPRPAGAPS